MLTVMITWLILDIVAILLLLYDYNRWYGHAHKSIRPPQQAGRQPSLDIEKQATALLSHSSCVGSS
ncbi:MAG: hypothetical protein ACREJU_12115 [Nitrospiraceae bacterium]